jgi:hypothetical protein
VLGCCRLLIGFVDVDGVRLPNAPQHGAVLDVELGRRRRVRRKDLLRALRRLRYQIGVPHRGGGAPLNCTGIWPTE